MRTLVILLLTISPCLAGDWQQGLIDAARDKDMERHRWRMENAERDRNLAIERQNMELREMNDRLDTIERQNRAIQRDLDWPRR